MTEQPRPPRPDTPRMAASSATRQEPPDQFERDLSSEVSAVSEATAALIERQTAIYKQSALGLSKTTGALHGLRQAGIQGALIAAGGGPESVAAGETALSSGGSNGGAAVTIQQVATPDTVLANKKSQTVQSVSGAVGVLVSTMWLAYFGKDAPPEVYAAIPLFVMAAQQAFATFVNTRK